MYIETNKYQTPITDELLAEYPEEIQEWFYDFVTNVPFIKNLISPNRKYARDLPRDEKGRIIVDITNPHIIEDADYFRQPALHFMKYQCYTFLKPNSNPHSEYRRFWDEELRRCRDGYVRPSDGEWVTGFCYWFLNYCPMMVNMITEGRKKAIRTESFPFFFEGIYLRFHYLWQARENGKHAIELAKRGCAKSYALASIMSHNLILGENAESCRRVITVLTAYEKEYLKDDKDGTLSKFKPAINFQFTNTPFPHLLLKNSPNEMTWQMGYKDELGIERGSLNQVLGVSAKDNPDKLRGKRGWILFEEMGSFKGLLALYDTTRKSVEDGDYTFATMYLVGTAAEKESDFSSAKTLLYSPDGYNILALPNVYDKQKQGKTEFGFFFPSYVNRAGCYNKDGVSDVVKALLQILTARYKAKYSADPKSVLRVIAEDPVTPQEAIIKVKNAYFPIQQIEERIAQIDQNPRFYDDTYVGFMVQNQNGEAEFKNTTDIPIRDFPTADNKEHGAIEIFVMPERDSRGKKFENRYIAGIDPIDNDSSETMSLFSIHILDLFTDQLVAEYTGRLDFVDDCYEQARLLLMFYNAVANYENNLKGLYSYFRKMNCTHLLCDTPEYLKDKQLIKVTSTGNNIKGVRATAPINNYANGLLRDWLLKPVTVISKNEEGQDIEVSIPNLFLIKNRAVLKELALFTPEMNVDRIRALGMLMLYREEKIILYQGDMSKAAEEKIESDYLGNDDYFSRNFKVNQRQFSKFSKFNILG